MKTYARSKKKILVHDLFGVAEGNPPSHGHWRTSSANNTSAASTPLSETSESADASHQLRQELHTSTNVSASSRKASPPLIKSTELEDASSPSLFDFWSSSDEIKSKHTKKAQKPRKPTSKSAKARPLQSMNAAGDLNTEMSSPPETVANKPASQSKLKSRTADKKPHAQTKSRPEARSKEGEEKDQNIFNLDSPSPRHSSAVPASPNSHRSDDSMVSTRSTPKRKRDEDDALSDLSSPSQLGISSLHLSPNQRLKARSRAKELKQCSNTSRTPSTSRGRTVDRLDSPSRKLRSEDVQMIEASPRPLKSRKMVTTQLPQGDEKSQLQPQHPQGEHSGNSHSDGQAPIRRTGTYGKQRSHLGGMTSASENQREPSSQQSLQELVSQVDALASRTQFEFEDSSGEEGSGPRLKSYRELKHGGSASHSSGELEAILEEIESDVKAIRLRGLMGLVRKLQEKTYKTHLLSSGKLHRLVRMSSPKLDLVSSAVLLLALWALTVAESATAQALSEIYDCLVQLPPALFKDKRTLSRSAKDRKENLAKATVRDIIDFEQHVVNKSIKHEGQAEHIIPSRVAIKCLEASLSRVVSLQARVVDPPMALVDVVVDCIEDCLGDATRLGDQPESVESIRLLTSWLQFTAASSQLGHQAPASLLERIGEVMGQVVVWSKQNHVAIQQLSIVATVELSNGNQSLLEHFAATSILPAAMDVVATYFASLGSGSIDVEQLKSAVLALGLLLNLADSGEGAKDRMADSKPSTVDTLISIFNQHVDQVTEATSNEYGQAIGPFGYVSLLLCTVCLSNSIQQSVARQIDLRRLVAVAETCLRILAAATAGVADGFVDRFSATVEEVKRRSG